MAILIPEAVLEPMDRCCIRYILEVRLITTGWTLGPKTGLMHVSWSCLSRVQVALPSRLEFRQAHLVLGHERAARIRDG